MSKVFIIAEAGSNWRLGNYNRDQKMGKVLIEEAAKAGADAIKFQTYKPETVYVPNAGSSDYLSDSGINEPISEIFQDLSMPYDMLPILAEHAKKNDLEFMSTPFSVNDAKAIDPFVNRHKIASYEITHYRLLEFIATTGKPLILSTGGTSIEDINWAVKHFQNCGGQSITLMQTTAKYPAPIESLNVKTIPTLQKEFSFPIGLSDHSRDPIIGPVAAVALGATVIEKHFTLHNKLPGPDHSFAITPNELKRMVFAIRECEKCLGDGNKVILDVENELKNYAQRSIQAITQIKKNDILKEGVNVDILRSGNQSKGIHPKNIIRIQGCKAKRDIKLGEGILEDDYE